MLRAWVLTASLLAPLLPTTGLARPIFRSKVLLSPDGTPTSLVEAGAGRPLAVIVLKGHWSDLCRASLTRIAGVHEQVKRLGGTIVALDSDAPSTNVELGARLYLPFPIISDPNADVLRNLDLWVERASHPEPALVFLDRCGELSLRWPGRLPGERDDQMVLEVMSKLAADTHACDPVM